MPNVWWDIIIELNYLPVIVLAWDCLDLNGLGRALFEQGQIEPQHPESVVLS